MTPDPSNDAGTLVVIALAAWTLLAAVAWKGRNR